MGDLLYLFSILLFGGAALIIEIYTSHGRLHRYYQALLVIVVLCLLGSLSDSLGRHWGLWHYNPQHTLHVHLFGAEVESYVFTVVVGLVITIPAILWADDFDAHRSFLAHLKLSNKIRK